MAVKFPWLFAFFLTSSLDLIRSNFIGVVSAMLTQSIMGCQST